jgi:hypothetical protein
MTTLEQAARQALEALETISVDVKTTSNAYEAQRQAIDALRQALEQPTVKDYLKVDQQKREPVAWWNPRKDTVSCDPVHRHHPDCTPLYTEPPKREWVGLTDEEIQQGLKETWVTIRAWQSAVWWAEERLKELNT